MADDPGTTPAPRPRRRRKDVDPTFVEPPVANERRRSKATRPAVEPVVEMPPTPDTAPPDPSVIAPAVAAAPASVFDLADAPPAAAADPDPTATSVEPEPVAAGGRPRPRCGPDDVVRGPGGRRHDRDRPARVLAADDRGPLARSGRLPVPAGGRWRRHGGAGPVAGREQSMRRPPRPGAAVPAPAGAGLPDEQPRQLPAVPARRRRRHRGRGSGRADELVADARGPGLDRAAGRGVRAVGRVRGVARWDGADRRGRGIGRAVSRRSSRRRHPSRPRALPRPSPPRRHRPSPRPRPSPRHRRRPPARPRPRRHRPARHRRRVGRPARRPNRRPRATPC